MTQQLKSLWRLEQHTRGVWELVAVAHRPTELESFAIRLRGLGWANLFRITKP